MQHQPTRVAIVMALVSLALGSGALPASPLGTAAAVDLLPVTISECSTTSDHCTFECGVKGQNAYDVVEIQVELTGSGDGHVTAYCNGSSAAECGGAPCTGTGDGWGDGSCEADGSYDEAICRAVIWQPDINDLYVNVLPPVV